MDHLPSPASKHASCPPLILSSSGLHHPIRTGSWALGSPAWAGKVQGLSHEGGHLAQAFSHQEPRNCRQEPPLGVWELRNAGLQPSQVPVLPEEDLSSTSPVKSPHMAPPPGGSPDHLFGLPPERSVYSVSVLPPDPGSGVPSACSPTYLRVSGGKKQAKALPTCPWDQRHSPSFGPQGPH